MPPITQPIIQLPMTGSERLYNEARSLIGQHLTLDSNVPPELGCAECMSVLLDGSGVKGIPAGGFEGTIALQSFFAADDQFEEMSEPEVGGILVAVTNGSQHGHVAVFAQFNLQYPDDWGLLSNNSDTGTLMEQWSLSRWNGYYAQEMGLKNVMYRLK